MKTKIKKPVIHVAVIPPPAIPKPVRKVITTYHPRYGYIKREVIE